MKNDFNANESRSDDDDQIAQMVTELNNLRDNLTELSLALHDFIFEVEMFSAIGRQK